MLRQVVLRALLSLSGSPTLTVFRTPYTAARPRRPRPPTAVRRASAPSRSATPISAVRPAPRTATAAVAAPTPTVSSLHLSKDDRANAIVLFRLYRYVQVSNTSTCAYPTVVFTFLVSAEANQGTFIVSPGTALYWTYASCQVYMNNELNPAQDIVYCYDWGSCACFHHLGHSSGLMSFITS